jgi:tetratricopeptide (TPR) repeat protein
VNPNASSNVPSDRSTDQEAMAAYKTGQMAFERGLYRDAIDWFEKALMSISSQSLLGGEIQMWLVTAYDAAGRGEEAISLCRQLSSHAQLEIRHKSKRLLYILEAPKLQSKPEWLTQIPDLDPPNAAPRRYSAVGQPGQLSKAKSNEPKSITEEPFEPIDPKESRGFLSVALGLSAIILLGLWWRLNQISG